jgi:Transposase IS200 like
MARGDRREEIFRDDRDRWKFLSYLSEGAERYRVKVHYYVLMENHLHLVATCWKRELESGPTGKETIGLPFDRSRLLGELLRIASRCNELVQI